MSTWVLVEMIVNWVNCDLTCPKIGDPNSDMHSDNSALPISYLLNFIARICEQFTEVFLVLFLQNHITRKMHVLSIVAPMQIRQQWIVYKMLKIEQAGEVLHKKLNDLDTQFNNEKDLSQRYFKMLRELENKYYVWHRNFKWVTL